MDHTFATDMSSPLSLKDDPAAPCLGQESHDYNFSGATYDEGIESASTTDEDVPGYRAQQNRVASRQSSVSSFPASVVHHAPLYDRASTPTRSPFSYPRAMTPNYSPRPYSTGFRHPSSVRALQMRDEFDSTDCEEVTPGHIRHNSKLSYVSYRTGSSHSSPTRSIRASRSAQTSPTKLKPKQEYPLVLLHCTLLPPTLVTRARQLSPEAGDKESVLEAIIPEPYAKRWRTLQEKVIKNSQVKTRGVLISHPREEYELLEERLLESLELERPRIREGHYLSHDLPDTSTDSGFESAGADTDSEPPCEDLAVKADEIHCAKCTDCGNSLSSGVELARKWEIKVFAANGLMKAGAWNAAWSEMEKVDVEVGVWMPETVRREVDARLEALITREQEEKTKKEKKRRGMDDERAREIYGAPHEATPVWDRNRAQIDGLADTSSGIAVASLQNIPQQTASSNWEHEQQHQQHEDQHQQRQQHRVAPAQQDSLPEVPLSLAFARYFSLLAQDPRNMAIVLLSVLLLYYGFSTGPNTATPISDLAGIPRAVSASTPIIMEARSDAPASMTAHPGIEVDSASPTEIDISVTSSLKITSTKKLESGTSESGTKSPKVETATNADLHTAIDIPGTESTQQPLSVSPTRNRAVSENASCRLGPMLLFGEDSYCRGDSPLSSNSPVETAEGDSNGEMSSEVRRHIVHEQL